MLCITTLTSDKGSLNVFMPFPVIFMNSGLEVDGHLDCNGIFGHPKSHLSLAGLQQNNIQGALSNLKVNFVLFLDDLI